jgi:hypothetical protein
MKIARMNRAENSVNSKRGTIAAITPANSQAIPIIFIGINNAG